MLSDFIVGLKYLANGARSVLRADRTGALVTVDGHARYAESTMQGRRFLYAVGSSFTPPSPITSTAATCGLYNPANSGVNAIIDDIIVGFATAPSGSTGIYLGSISPPSVPGLATWLDFPMIVPASNEIVFDAAASTGTQTVIGLTWHTNTVLEPRPAGETLTVRADITSAAPTANPWSDLSTQAGISIVWEYNLPPGRYAVVGSECISATSVAHRWIFEGANYRPGALSGTAVGNIPHPYGLNGVLGKWGEFTAPLMPRLEALCTAADSTLTAFLQVVALS